MTSTPDTHRTAGNVAFDLGSTKQAALFFDHVIPINGVDGFRITDGIENYDAESSRRDSERIIRELLPPNFGTESEVADFVSTAAIGIGILSVAVGFYNCKSMSDKADEFLEKLTRPAGMKFYSELPATIDPALVTRDLSNDDTGGSSALLSIANIQIPDVAALDWDRILEIRKDSISKQKLRRLRVFAFKEYAGRSRTFIEDDLAIRLEDFEDTLTAWGIRTTLGALSTAISERDAIAFGLGSVLGTMCGLPIPATLFATLAIPFTKFSIELAKARLDLQSQIKEHPLAYVMELKQRIGHPQP